MNAELWTPSAEDMESGQDAYIRYIGGLMLLHDPENDVSQGVIGDAWREATVTDEEVVVQAENIMYRSLRIMIFRTNPPDFRSPLSSAESRHDQASPHIRSIVAKVCESKAKRLDEINPAIKSMRPMPLADPAIYAYLCHGRRYKIQTRRLLDDFMPAPLFSSILAGRVLPSPPRSPHQQLLIRGVEQN